MKKKMLIVPLLMATTCVSTVLADGSMEKGFVPPPKEKKLPPAPPRSISSAETFVAGGAPVTPMARTEAKKPPKPPVLVTKLKDEKGVE